MNKYSFTGTYKRAGSIGVSEKFTALRDAETAQEAMEAIRIEFYTVGDFDHILFKTCKENGKEITMLEALGLE